MDVYFVDSALGSSVKYTKPLARNLQESLPSLHSVLLVLDKYATCCLVDQRMMPADLVILSRARQWYKACVLGNSVAAEGSCFSETTSAYFMTNLLDSSRAAASQVVRLCGL